MPNLNEDSVKQSKSDLLNAFFKIFPEFKKDPKSLYTFAIILIEWVRSENAKNRPPYKKH